MIGGYCVVNPRNPFINSLSILWWVSGLWAYLSDWVINSFGIDLVLTKPCFEVLLVRTIQLGLHSFSSQLMYEIFNFKNILDDLVRRVIIIHFMKKKPYIFIESTRKQRSKQHFVYVTASIGMIIFKSVIE